MVPIYMDSLSKKREIAIKVITFITIILLLFNSTSTKVESEEEEELPPIVVAPMKQETAATAFPEKFWMNYDSHIELLAISNQKNTSKELESQVSIESPAPTEQAKKKEKKNSAETSKHKETTKKNVEKSTKKTKTEYSWAGSVLTAKSGVNYGPTGKETYYNLPMDGVVKIMHSKGFEGKYWVREDGVKMFGDYIMVAANLERFPRGTIVKTSLGLAIVSDTGSFAESNPTQLDIAVTW